MWIFVPRRLSLDWVRPRARALVAAALALVALGIGPLVALVALRARGSRTLETAAYRLPLPRGFAGGVDAAVPSRVVLRQADPAAGSTAATVMVRAFAGQAAPPAVAELGACTARAQAAAADAGGKVVAPALATVDGERACRFRLDQAGTARATHALTAHGGTLYTVECAWDTRDPAGGAACEAVLAGLRWR